MQAGYRGAEAVPYFYGTRMAIAIGAFVLFATPILFRPNVAVGLGGSLLGYVLPGIVLARMAKKRQHKMQLALADALDLMVVSVEAGLGLDQAIMRVGDELAFAYPDLSDELQAGEHRAARRQGAHAKRCATWPIGPASRMWRR